MAKKTRAAKAKKKSATSARATTAPQRPDALSRQLREIGSALTDLDRRVTDLEVNQEVADQDDAAGAAASDPADTDDDIPRVKPNQGDA